MFNIFTPKKKPTLQQNMSVNTKMTPAAKPQGTYQSIINSMQMPKVQLAQKSLAQPARTSAVSASVQRPIKPQMSVAPKAPQMSVNRPQIQGSGMTGQYASNPTNYKPPQAPAPTPVRTPSPLDGFTQNIGNTANQKMKFLQDQQAGAENYIKGSYGLQRQALQNQLPQAQDAFNRFKATTEADIADMQASGTRQKDQASDYYGDAQRQAAQVLRETRGQTQKTFSNLGTVDSYGEGSFKQATENTDSEFNRYTQQNLKAKADRLAEIDMQVGQAERQAQSLLAQKASELQALETQISIALSQNQMDEAEALRGQYAQTQDLIFQVQDTVDQLKYQQAVEKNNFDMEMSKSQLSPEFMTTGVPTTQADFMFRLNNPDNVSKAFAEQTKSGAKQEIVNVLDKLAGGDIGAITGTVRTGWVPGSQGALTKNYYDQLKSMLSLENRQQLKGSGAISDFEAKILANAASALGQNLSADQFRTVLNDLRTQLGGGQATTNPNDPLGLGI